MFTNRGPERAGSLDLGAREAGGPPLGVRRVSTSGLHLHDRGEPWSRTRQGL